MEGPMRKLLFTAAVVVLVAPALAHDGMKVIKPDGLAWKEHPLFKEAQIVILVGDPKKAETVVQRVKFPPNFKIPPHTHPYAEVITVISGSAGWGAGEKFDTASGQMVKVGGLMTNPAKHAHFMWTGNEGAILQIHFIGPGGTDFVNPADDPRKK